MPVPQPLPSRLIGALFVERGLVSESQIRIALEIQTETGQQLGQILVERFGVSRRELASVVAEQWAKLGGSAGPEDTASWRRLGEIFVDRGFVSEDELEQALARQRQTGERLGEALVAQGVISKFELAGALAEQMAALEGSDADAAQSPAAEATVHHLSARQEEQPDVAPAPVLELVPSEQNGAGPAEIVDVSVEASEIPALDETPEAAPEESQEPDDEVFPVVGTVADADEAPAGDVALMEPPVDEFAFEETVVDDIVFAEPTVGDVGFDEPAVGDVGIAAELAIDDVVFVDPVVDDVMFEEPAVDDVRVEEPAVHEVAAPEPAVACVAFAPTTTGYRLVPLDAVPVPGEAIDVPDVGLRLVLRVGRSPYPLDDRICAFVEEPAVWALAVDAIH